ncbi:hypothetical protein [Caulobacter sp. NIBR1757]|uniref:hypothetical protein n=1 Tax=Caulobacter sp. NIBR1757 TaxID=3016000 RepID=UPI0022F0118C|nr:hypothetical protein [Caulobacter sp. NIBR1757]WGM41228.1 hypothetical protein AMEJIAPC_04178 [Caulobacter sp. NIBR1757]
MDKAFVAQRVATKLFSTEKAIDAAMVEAAELLAGAVEARAQLKLSAVTGDKAQAKLVEAIGALAQARTAIVEMHHEMADLKLRVGIRTKLIGVEEKPEEETKPKGLREVG